MNPRLLRILCAVLAGPLLLVGCQATSSGGEKIYKQGVTEAKNGSIEQAMKTLQAGAKKFPDHVQMRFQLARLQYETGEAHHLKERQAMRAGAEFASKSQREEAATNRSEAAKHRSAALPFYQAARKNLRYVVENAKADRDIAWASFVLMRVDVFFEDWEAANEDIERAIELGKPSGIKLAQWKEFQAGLKDKLRSNR